MVPSYSFSIAIPQFRSSVEPQQCRAQQSQFCPLEEVVRPMLTTEEAAFYLNRKPQTLRVWACRDDGPIRPLRLHGRLGWPIADIRRYLAVEQPQGTVKRRG
jgi:hypothetical protein